jgi:2-amino-4-hydroxy-6-hydroxymethyldihydropteridine diphosphokinase
MSPSAYIGFGANLGDRKGKFEEAVLSLGILPRTVVKRCSRLYETEPVGIVDEGPQFLNGVVELETELAPEDLFREMRTLELQLGKALDHRSDRSRIVDLDLLLYGNDCIQSAGMTVPHPRMQGRAFVLVPLAELASEAVVPCLSRTVAELLADLTVEEINGVHPAESGAD